ncbi:hypothetical protein ABZZ20_00685 [Streptomyces sp. NPDC006430]|uniref:hypothetical protein n=1 Tax=Streptomyces sp. NPDC006430 TaxID=3154299 RepID=UPI0033AD13DA
MTTAPVVEPLTVRAFLLGREEGRSTHELAEFLHENEAASGILPGVRGLTSTAGRAVETELASVIDGFLDLDLISLAAGGWSKHAALKAAARRTRRTLGSEEVVALATHSITSTHRPYVDVLVDGARAATVDVELTVVFRISGLVAVVRDGQLIALRGAACTVEARLSVRQRVLLSRQGRLDLPATLHLHSPIDLLPLQAPPPVAPPHAGLG